MLILWLNGWYLKELACQLHDGGEGSIDISEDLAVGILDQVFNVERGLLGLGIDGRADQNQAFPCPVEFLTKE